MSTAGDDKMTKRSASPFARAHDSSLTSQSQHSDKSSAPAATNEPARNVDTESANVRRSTYDFQAVLRKYNIRLDDPLPSQAIAEAPKSTEIARSEEPRFQLSQSNQTIEHSHGANETASRWPYRVQQQNGANAPENVTYDSSVTTSKYEASRGDSRRLEETDASPTYSNINAPPVRTSFTANRATPTVNTSAYAVPSSASTSSITNVPSTLRATTAPSVSTGEDNSATITVLRKQLAERDAECAALRRQLEDERERLRRTQSSLAAATSAAATASAAAQPDPSAAARLIELDTLRERYEELVAEKTLLEETVDRLRHELKAAKTFYSPQLQLQSQLQLQHQQLQLQPQPQPQPQLHSQTYNTPVSRYSELRADDEVENDMMMFQRRSSNQCEPQLQDFEVADEADLIASYQRNDRALAIDRDRDYHRERPRSTNQSMNHNYPSAAVATVPAPQAGNSEALLSTNWRRDTQVLRERHRATAAENTALRAQILAAKRMNSASASTLASASASTTAADSDAVRYYQAQLADARDTVRKLQERLSHSAPRSDPQRFEAASSTRSAQSAVGGAEPYARRPESYVWKTDADYGRPSSPARAFPASDAATLNRPPPLDLRAATASPVPRYDPENLAYGSQTAHSSALSGAAVSANINRLLDRTGLPPAHPRMQLPMKATVPPSLNTAAQPQPQPAVASAASAYRQLFDDVSNRRSRLSSSETQMVNPGSNLAPGASAYFGGPKYVFSNGQHSSGSHSYAHPSAYGSAASDKHYYGDQRGVGMGIAVGPAPGAGANRQYTASPTRYSSDPR